MRILDRGNIDSESVQMNLAQKKKKERKQTCGISTLIL